MFQGLSSASVGNNGLQGWRQLCMGGRQAGGSSSHGHHPCTADHTHVSRESVRVGWCVLVLGLG